jgi:PAS domain S-box-containing protein
MSHPGAIPRELDRRPAVTRRASGRRCRPGRFWGLALVLLWLGIGPALAGSQVPATADFRSRLTESEQAFLAGHPVLRLGVAAGQNPFQHIRRSPDGTPHYLGLAADYLDVMAPMLGVTFAPAFDVSFTQALELAQTGEIDLFACITDTPGRRAFLHLTRPYASHPFVMVSRTNGAPLWNMADLAGKTVAVSPTYYAYERLQSEHPELGIRFDFKRNAIETLAAVAAGKADACFLNLVAAAAIIRERGLDNLRIVAVMPWPDNIVCMASPDPLLAGILQKALDAIPQERKTALAARWFDAATHPERGQTQWPRRWLLLGGAAAVLAGAVWWRRRRLGAEAARRQAAECDLSHHRETLEAVLNATNDAILVLDQSYHVVMVNRTGAERFGLAVEAMIGHGILELTDAPVAATRRERYREAQESGQPVRFTDTRAGHVYENTIYPIPAPPGGRPRLAIYARDVTEQLAASLALQHSQDRLATIFRLSPVVVTVTASPEGRFLDVNEAFCTVSGFARDDVINRSPTELGMWLSLADRDRITRAIERDGQVRNMELALRMRDGRLVAVLLSCTPIEAYDQPCLLSVVVDITGRKSMEEALRLAKESAEAANRAKSRFLSTMSHEIRTPMNTILGMVDVLRGTPLSDRQQDFLRTLEMAGESLMALLTDILELSKIESGVLELVQEAYDPVELLHHAAALLAPQAAAKGLALRAESAPDVPRQAWGDAGRISQILVNLAGNAVKFTSQGEVVLRLSALPGRPDREELLFCVADTGIGIPPEKREAIFKPFTQGDSSTTRAYGGTGLGLAISTLLADGMGGRLWVDSTAGTGSTFSCAIPRDGRQGNAPSALPARAAPGQESPLLTAGRRSLLIVEDSEPNRLLYEAFLEGLPLTVSYAQTGSQALDRLDAALFDAIIMDIQLPDIDGLTVIQEIRRREAAAGRPATPILVVTAFAFREENSRATAVGASALLTKPIGRSTLLAHLGRLLEPAGRTGPANGRSA